MGRRYDRESGLARRQGVRQKTGDAQARSARPPEIMCRFCHAAGGELEQIQFLLGQVSVQTTERYYAQRNVM